MNIINYLTIQFEIQTKAEKYIINDRIASIHAIRSTSFDPPAFLTLQLSSSRPL